MSKYHKGSHGGADEWTNFVLAELKYKQSNRRTITSYDGIIDDGYLANLEKNRKERAENANIPYNNSQSIEQKTDKLQAEIAELQNEMLCKREELNKLQVKQKEKNKQPNRTGTGTITYIDGKPYTKNQMKMLNEFPEGRRKEERRKKVDFTNELLTERWGSVENYEDQKQVITYSKDGHDDITITYIDGLPYTQHQIYMLDNIPADFYEHMMSQYDQENLRLIERWGSVEAYEFNRKT